MYIGIDLGGTNIAAGLVDGQARLLAEYKIKTQQPTSADTLARQFRQAALGLCREQGVEPGQIQGIGIGVPGAVDPDALVMDYANNLNTGQLCVGGLFRPEFACPVYLENDANTAALGEWRTGAAGPVRSLVMVTLGTGIGGGVILDGALYTGFNHLAGEVGHMVVEIDGWPCTCGRRGCWEAYASATGLVRMTRQALEEHPESLLHQEVAARQGKVSARAPFLAAAKGDAAAQQVVERYIKYLACGINNLINCFQPERIVLGGGISGEGERLLAPLRRRVQAELYRAHCPQAEIVCARAGNRAGVIGAALLGTCRGDR